MDLCAVDSVGDYTVDGVHRNVSICVSLSSHYLESGWSCKYSSLAWQSSSQSHLPFIWKVTLYHILHTFDDPFQYYFTQDTNVKRRQTSLSLSMVRCTVRGR